MNAEPFWDVVYKTNRPTQSIGSHSKVRRPGFDKAVHLRLRRPPDSLQIRGQLRLKQTEAARSVTTDRATPGNPDQELAGKLARLAELEAAASVLRHDLRGMLAPALLVVDRLLAHSDPKVAKAGETVLKAIGRVEERLVATRSPARDKRLG